MQSRHTPLLFLLIFVFSAFATVAQDYEPIFEEDDCPFPELERVTCGYLIVPEDRDNPDGNEVELAVAFIEASGDKVSDIPIIYLEGGPGGAALLAIDDWLTFPLSENHDLILFDQRGTGFSYPSLNCYEIEEEEEDDPVTACRDRLLDEGVDLNQYNSAASAADVEDLRIALGYDTVKLYGISYGTRLALTVMRDFPDGIDSVVIDSMYPPEIDDLALSTLSRVGAIEALFALCASDPDCSDTYPDLESDFYDMVVRLDESPAELETEDGIEELFGSDVTGALITALYASDIIPYLPYAITLIANAEDEADILDALDIMQGAYIPGMEDEEEFDDDIPETILDSEEVQEYFEEYGEIDDSEGMNYSVDCSEEYALNDIDQAFELAESAPPELSDAIIQEIEQTLADCDIWGVETADAIEAELVFSDIPVLIVSGALDPVTPPDSGDSALEGLSAGQHIIFPTAGHGITATQTPAGECATGLLLAFFEDFSVVLDISCIEETSAPNFYLGD